LMKVAAANGLVAPPTAVGAFVRRQMANVDVERRKRIEAMVSLEPVVTGPTIAPLPVVQAGGGADAAVSADQLPEELGEKKFARTMIIPPRDQGGRLSVPTIFEQILGTIIRP